MLTTCLYIHIYTYYYTYYTYYTIGQHLYYLYYWWYCLNIKWFYTIPIVSTSHGGTVATLGTTVIVLFVYVHLSLLLLIFVFNLFAFVLIKINIFSSGNHNDIYIHTELVHFFKPLFHSVFKNVSRDKLLIITIYIEQLPRAKIFVFYCVIWFKLKYLGHALLRQWFLVLLIFIFLARIT